MNILVTGANGQLGNEIKQAATDLQTPYTWLYTDADDLDITKEEEVTNFFTRHSIQFVINCAAYTAVDKAETEQEQAKRINTEAPKILATACALHNAKFIHISTDYVFDGKAYTPYKETDKPNPQSIYGATKLQGEQAALAAYTNTCIIRTSWLYSSYNNNFVKTMMRLGKERSELSVVFDQIGSPTYAKHLAYAILTIIERSATNTNGFIPGIYHFSNEGVCSWYDFAKEIFDTMQANVKLLPIESKDYPTPAARPHFSVMNKQKIKETYSLSISHWKDALQECMKLL